MKMELWAVGKLKDHELESKIDQYLKRMQKYQTVRIQELSVRTKSTDAGVLRRAEGEKILSRLSDKDYLILIDENGQRLSSVKFAQLIQKTMMRQVNRIILLIGGAYGFDQAVNDRAQKELSLSLMTFPHDLARLIMVEQLYRAFTILNHSPYHH